MADNSEPKGPTTMSTRQLIARVTRTAPREATAPRLGEAGRIDQAAAAARLSECFRSFNTDLSYMDILEALAVVGLRFTDDGQGEAGRAYRAAFAGLLPADDRSSDRRSDHRTNRAA